MAEQMSLESILDDKEPPSEPTAIVEAPAEPAAPAEPIEAAPEALPVEKVASKRKAYQAKEKAAQDAGRVRDEEGKFVAKEAETPAVEQPETPPVPPAAVTPPHQDMTDKEKAFLRAAQEERNKRQELERRLAALEKPPAAPTPFWDNPEQAINEFKREMQGVALNSRLNTAETIARSKHPDFDDKVAVFAQVLQQTPGLHHQWLSSPDPAEFAYWTGKNHQDLQTLGSIDAMKAKIEADTEARVRAKIEAEYKAKAEEQAKLRSALPGSLSDAHGSPVNRPLWNGPTSLDDILAGK